MHRFPNPGSDIDSFVRIFQVLHEEIGANAEFSLDDISIVLVKRNLASSSGYMGREALARSYNEDRSRDKIYNQSKMYAELFRALGWFRTASSRLNFRFSYLGEHIAEARNKARELVEESVLGMAFPNEVIDVIGRYKLRPFLCILRTINSMDGLLCRDEMIVGPQSISDDRDETAFNAMLGKLRSYREGKAKIQSALDEISYSRRITFNTMGNYTRFPLAVLGWTNWTTKEKLSGVLPGGRRVFHKITDYGKKRISELECMIDLRSADIESLGIDQQKSISRIAFFEMLKRSGFDTSSFQHIIENERKSVPNKFQNVQILFSPFQELSSEKLDLFFGELSTSVDTEKSTASIANYATSAGGVLSLISDIESDTPINDLPQASDTIDWIKSCLQNCSNKNDALLLMMVQAKQYNKEHFYPLISDLFKIIGLNCEVSRHGINYQRWDAIIKFEDDSIPIEIKSPGEELHLSVKAVRQALENKIILQSRKSYPNQMSTTSLAVGYLPPKNRSEVIGLVSDINTTYNLNIGIIDLESLLNLAINAIMDSKIPSTLQIKRINGLVDV